MDQSQASPFLIARWTEAALPDGLARLTGEAIAEGFAWMADFRREWAERPFVADREGLFIAFDEAEPVGMAVICEDPYVGGSVGRLRFIFVTKRVRGRGLARRLLERCLEEAGHRWSRLRLHTDNPIAARLYADYGFRPVDEPRTTHATARAKAPASDADPA